MWPPEEGNEWQLPKMVEIFCFAIPVIEYLNLMI
jgi:hypothetical protein